MLGRSSEAFVAVPKLAFRDGVVPRVALFATILALPSQALPSQALEVSRCLMAHTWDITNLARQEGAF